MEIRKIERAIAKEVAVNIENFIDNQFIQKKDPFGKRWEKDKNGNPFDPDEVIHSSITTKAKGNEVITESPLDYLLFHQYGTSKMPQRMIYPDEVLPAKWSRAMQESIDTILDEEFMNLQGGDE